MKTFQNKVAVITGAGSGMGRYLALNLAQEGCNVAICDINTSSLKETEELIKNYNISCSTHNLDLRDKSNIDILVKETLLNHGKVDLLFNNAGVVSPSAFLEMKESDWDWCNDINFNSLVYCSRAFLPHLMKDEESALVNTSSIFVSETAERGFMSSGSLGHASNGSLISLRSISIISAYSASLSGSSNSGSAIHSSIAWALLSKVFASP